MRNNVCCLSDWAMIFCYQSSSWLRYQHTKFSLPLVILASRDSKQWMLVKTLWISILGLRSRFDRKTSKSTHICTPFSSWGFPWWGRKLSGLWIPWLKGPRERLLSGQSCKVTEILCSGWVAGAELHLVSSHPHSDFLPLPGTSCASVPSTEKA